jgi:hypothetical protein
MKTRPTLKATVTTGTLLLSGVFLFAQVASTTAPATSAAPEAKTAPISKSATVQPYKDPEDMTTRSTKAPALGTGNNAAEQKKHLAGVKYSDRTAAENGTLDSKQASDKK